ncbi:TIR domain-containing protein [Candidatus Viadribacter manganicus]|uniref:TIR domain-containing protein n=1 Tax=Candidatus Viadribacter manganicus TaxID=1759059 RepID=A0A1B1ALX2_9PROT|nr:TIR domain-containing protein [Candidatus Viadribacter manganicus]ANP47554.1 hypothetical protein ATE48_17410 [Candidatus Viadribacter manganicus]
MPDDIARASAAPAAQTGKRFSAFISYSHRDEEFGDWLHKRLESYEVPSALVGRASSVGQIGKRLGKVFRDRADLSAAHDLGREIREGLEQSDALIVLCSPRSCGSKYVQDEIRIFKQLGKGQRIFAAIIDGEPHAAGRPGYTAADECFPPSLIFALNHDGSVSSQLEPTEPIAADFRDGKDGRENGSLKIIAGLLDVGLDELVQREKQAERARRRRANLIAAAMGVLALGAAGAGGYAWYQQGQTAVARDEALANFNLAEDRAKAERLARADADVQRGVAETQRGIAVSEAEKARIQELAAIANAEEASAQRDAARNSLARIFAERSWQSMERGNYLLAARYALAGYRASKDIAEENDRAPANEGEYRSALGRILHDSNDSRALRGHADLVRSAVFSPDGALMLTVSDDNTARVWDVASRRVIAGWRHGFRLRVAAFSPDGSRVVTAAGSARVWEVVGEREIAAFGGDDRDVTSIAFSPDGARVVTGDSDGGVLVWNAAPNIPDGRREIAVLRGHGGEVTTVAFSRDGTRILTAARDGTARVWNADPNIAESQREIAVLRHEDLVVTSAAFSPDGARVVTASGNFARLWNAAPNVPNDRREIAALAHNDLVASVAFSSDGARVVTASWDDTARVWDAAPNVANDRREIAVLRGHDGAVWSAAFSPDGARVVTASPDHTARVWDVMSRREVATLRGHENGVESAVFSPDGIHVLTASADKTARLWELAFYDRDPNEGLNVHYYDETQRALELRIADANTTSVVDTASGREIAGLRGRIPTSGTYVSLSRDGSRIVTTTAADHVAKVWDVASGREIVALNGWVTTAALSPDGARVVTTSNDRFARLWDAASGREIAILGDETDAAMVTWALFSPDGAQVVTSRFDLERVNSPHTRVWNVRRLTQPLPELALAACANLLSPNGRRFSESEITGDPLIREVWLRDGREDRDVCEGVPGAPALE